MAIQTLNRGPGFGANFADSLSEGLVALAQHKIDRMNTRKKEDFYQSQGLSKDYAKMPDQFGLKALAEREATARSTAKNFAKQQEFANAFNAEASSLLRRGATKEEIDFASQAGPEHGLIKLRNISKDIDKTRKGGWVTAAPKSPYAKTDEESNIDALYARKKGGGQSGLPQYFQDLQQALQPTQAQQQEQRQQQYNTQLQQAQMQNPPKNSLDVFNNAAIQGLMEKEYAQEQQSAEQYREQEKQRKVQELLADPSLTPEEREMVIENSSPQKTWGQTILGAPLNLASGAIQGLTTLGGLTEHLPRFGGGNEVEVSPEERKKVEEKAQEGDPIAQSILKNLYNPELPERSMANVKNQIIRPIAEMIGAENLINTKDFTSKSLERAGKIIGPSAALKLLSGGAQALGLGTIVRPVVAESMGELTKRVTDSDIADIGVTGLGYALTRSLENIGSFKKAISNGYEGMRSLVNKGIGKVPIISSTNTTDAMEKVYKQQALDPNSRGAKFIRGKILAIQDKLGKTGATISARSAWELDQAFGKKQYEQAKKLGVENMLTELRQGLRGDYESYYSKLDKGIVQGLQAARKAEAALHFSDELQKRIEKVAKMRTYRGPIAALIYPIKAMANATGSIRKSFKVLQKSPLLASTFMQLLKGASEENTVLMARAIDKMKSMA